jgi:hypothetical protein
VLWHHELGDEPTLLYAEIDDHEWEHRKVDEYADGRRDFADKVHEMGSTVLGISPFLP